MTPVIYGKSETVFTSNGLGRLSDIINIKINDNLSNETYLELEYPVNGIHADLLLILDNIIKVESYKGGNPQLFRIARFKVAKGKITVLAEHISNLLNYRSIGWSGYNTCWDYFVTALNNQAGNTGNLDEIYQIGDFSFTVDFTDTPSDYEYDDARKSPCYAAGSVVDPKYNSSSFAPIKEWLTSTDKAYPQGAFCNVEFIADNYHITITKKRGTNKNITLKKGINLNNISLTSDIQNINTTIWGHGKVGNTEYTTTYISTGYESNLAYKRFGNIDLTDSELKDQAGLLSRANSWLEKNATYSQPLEISLTAVNNSEISEDLNTLVLGDTVTLVIEDLNINATVRLTDIEYDPILESYTKLTFDKNPKNNLAAVMLRSNNQIDVLKAGSLYLY